MVLTQQSSMERLKCLCLSFHTTMVLTQQRLNSLSFFMLIQFPYHYGSYATRKRTSITRWLNSRFHTTMVLTQRERERALHAGWTVVSIPLWFLRNGTDTFMIENGLYVSIPLWFLRNKLTCAPGTRTLPCGFPYHYGSYATGPCRGQTLIHSSCFHTTMVLTQLVDNNRALVEKQNRFHTTMVLTQRLANR